MLSLVECSEDCGKSIAGVKPYKIGSWFQIMKIREAEGTFVVKGPILNEMEESVIKNLKETKLWCSSFFVIDPVVEEDEDPPIDEDE